MAQNLVISGVTYNGVSSLSIPKSGGGSATFVEEGSGGLAIPDPIVAGDTPVLFARCAGYRASTSYGDVGLSFTIVKSGTYRFKWHSIRGDDSGTYGTRLMQNGTAVYTSTTWTGTYEQHSSYDLACSAGDVIKLQSRSGSSYYNIYINNFTACINWTTGF